MNVVQLNLFEIYWYKKEKKENFFIWKYNFTSLSPEVSFSHARICKIVPQGLTWHTTYVTHVERALKLSSRDDNNLDDNSDALISRSHVDGEKNESREV